MELKTIEEEKAVKELQEDIANLQMKFDLVPDGVGNIAFEIDGTLSDEKINNYKGLKISGGIDAVDYIRMRPLERLRAWFNNPKLIYCDGEWSVELNAVDKTYDISCSYLEDVKALSSKSTMKIFAVVEFDQYDNHALIVNVIEYLRGQTENPNLPLKLKLNDLLDLKR